MHLRTALLFVLLCAAERSDALEIATRVSSREIDLGDSFQVQITVENGELAETPQFPKGPYTVAGPHRGESSSIQIIIGRERRSSRTVQYTWEITPQKGGTITIPSFTIKGSDGKSYPTSQVTVSVRTPEDDPLFFLEVTAPQKNIYPEEEIEITLTMYAAQLSGKYQNADPFPNNRTGEPVWPHLVIPWIEEKKGFRTSLFEQYLHNLNTRSRGEGFKINNVGSFFGATKFSLPRKKVTRKGPDGIERDYFAYTLSRAFTAEQFGSFTFSPVIAKGYILYDTGRTIKHREIYTASKVCSVKVVPPPQENLPPFYTGAIGEFTIFTKASSQKVYVGDPISFELHIQGKGAMDKIAPLKLSEQEGFEKFKVYDDPKLGDVKNGSNQEKVYIYQIRPKDASIDAIPKVPFAFFSPSEEQFKTVYSDPIPLVVETSEGLARTEVFATQSPGTKPESDKIETTGRGIRADHIGLDALVPQKRFNPAGPLLVFFVLLPPLLYAFLAGFVTYYRKAHADPEKQRAKGAWPKAQANLKKARKALSDGVPSEIYPPLGSALAGFIADRIGLSEHSLTTYELKEKLQEKEVADEDIEHAVTIKEQCDAARFATLEVSQEQHERDVETVTALLHTLRKKL